MHDAEQQRKLASKHFSSALQTIRVIRFDIRASGNGLAYFDPADRRTGLYTIFLKLDAQWPTNMTPGRESGGIVGDANATTARR